MPTWQSPARAEQLLPPLHGAWVLPIFASQPASLMSTPSALASVGI